MSHKAHQAAMPDFVWWLPFSTFIVTLGMLLGGDRLFEFCGLEGHVRTVTWICVLAFWACAFQVVCSLYGWRK